MDNSYSSDSDEDLSEELQPLTYYVSDRRRILGEAMKVMEGERFEAMVPYMFRNWSRPKLETAFLNILEELKDDTLLAVLNGQVGTSEVTAAEQRENFSSSEARESSSEESFFVEEKTTKSKKKKMKKKLSKLKKKLKKVKKTTGATKGSGLNEGTQKSLMELLEIEYRSKAIKALLKRQGQSVPDIPINTDGEGNSENSQQEKTQDSSSEDEESLRTRLLQMVYEKRNKQECCMEPNGKMEKEYEKRNLEHAEMFQRSTTNDEFEEAPIITEVSTSFSPIQKNSLSTIDPGSPAKLEAKVAEDKAIEHQKSPCQNNADTATSTRTFEEIDVHDELIWDWEEENGEDDSNSGIGSNSSEDHFHEF